MNVPMQSRFIQPTSTDGLDLSSGPEEGFCGNNNYLFRFLFLEFICHLLNCLFHFPSISSDNELNGVCLLECDLDLYTTRMLDGFDQ